MIECLLNQTLPSPNNLGSRIARAPIVTSYRRDEQRRRTWQRELGEALLVEVHTEAEVGDDLGAPSFCSTLCFEHFLLSLKVRLLVVA